MSSGQAAVARADGTRRRDRSRVRCAGFAPREAEPRSAVRLAGRLVWRLRGRLRLCGRLRLRGRMCLRRGLGIAHGGCLRRRGGLRRLARLDAWSDAVVAVRTAHGFGVAVSAPIAVFVGPTGPTGPALTALLTRPGFGFNALDRRVVVEDGPLDVRVDRFRGLGW